MPKPRKPPNPPNGFTKKINGVFLKGRDEVFGMMRTLGRLLRKRGMSVAKLATTIHSNRTHVGQVLRGAPGRGGQTRRKLVQILTDDELKILGWTRDNVTRVTCSTGNIPEGGDAKHSRIRSDGAHCSL